MPARLSVILRYDRPGDPGPALQAVRASTAPPLEVVIAGAASPGALTPDKAVRGAAGELVAFVDASVVVGPEWLGVLAALLEARPDAAAAATPVQLDGTAARGPGGLRTPPLRGCLQVDHRTGAVSDVPGHADLGPGETREVAALPAGAVLWRRAALAAIGAPFFDRTLAPPYDGADACARALRRGWRLYSTGAAAARARADVHVEAVRAPAADAESDRLRFACRHFEPRALRRLVWREILRRPAWWLARARALRAERMRSRGGHLPWNATVRALQERAAYFLQGRPEVAALVPDGCRSVIDVGCGAGALGRLLKQSRPGIEVRGLEVAPEQAERARAVLDDAVAGRAEDGPPPSWGPADCVLFADVLEHLVDPWGTLCRWRKWVQPGGCIVVSVPNIAHRRVVRGLLHGRFTYADAGVLDRTHLRFFALASALALVQQAGFEVERVERVLDAPTRGPGRLLRAWIGRRPPREGPATGRRGLTGLVTDLYTLQFLIRARAPAVVAAQAPGSPLVSVVIATYNRRRYVVEAVESALGQTAGGIEVIVVDDGSSDGTGEALAPYHDRIRYFRQANAGQAAARNRGAREARGRSVAFLDSDDRWDPRRLERMLAFLERHPEVRVLGTAARVIDRDGRVAGRVLGPRRDALLTPCDFLDRHKGSLNGASVIIDRSLFLACGGFDASLRSAEDCDLWLRVSARGPIAVLGEPLLLYRRHDDNTSADVLRDARAWIGLLEKFAREQPELVARHPSLYRRALAKQNLRLGRELLAGAGADVGARREACAALGRSLRLQPLSPRALAYWLAARTAPRLYGRFRRWEIARRRGTAGAPPPRP